MVRICCEMSALEPSSFPVTSRGSLTPCRRIQTSKCGRREQCSPAKKATSLVLIENINHGLSHDTGLFGYDLRPTVESFWSWG